MGGKSTKTKASPWEEAEPYLIDALAAGGELSGNGGFAPAVQRFGQTTQNAMRGTAQLARDNPITNGAIASYGSLNSLPTMTGAIDFGAGVQSPQFGPGVQSPQFGAGVTAPTQVSAPQFGAGINTDSINQSISDRVMRDVASTFGRGGLVNSSAAQQAAAGSLGNALASYHYDAAKYNVGRDDANTMFATGVEEGNINRGVGVDQFNVARNDANTQFGTAVDQYNVGRNDANTQFGTSVDQYNVGRSDANLGFNAQLNEAGLDRGINRDLASIGAAAGINAQQYGDLSAMMGIGQMRDQRQQQLADRERQNVLGAGDFFGGLGGLGGVQSQPGQSAAGSILGAGAQGLGAYGMLAANPATAPFAAAGGIALGLGSLL